jgi:hypothetical protein
MFAEILRENAYGADRVRLEALLHIPTDASDQDIHELIEAGFSAGSVKALCDLGAISPLERDQIIPLKALKTRLARSQRLTVEESDRLFRVAHTSWPWPRRSSGTTKRPSTGSGSLFGQKPYCDVFHHSGHPPD